MSDYERKKKNKSRDIFGMLGDATYDGAKSYHNFWWDMWNYKYGLIGAVIAVIYFYGPDIFTQGYSAVIIFGIILAYTLLHYYVYEIEADEESSLHKAMNFMNTVFMVVLVLGALCFGVFILFFAFKEAGLVQ